MWGPLQGDETATGWGSVQSLQSVNFRSFPRGLAWIEKLVATDSQRSPCTPGLAPVCGLPLPTPEIMRIPLRGRRPLIGVPVAGMLSAALASAAAPAGDGLDLQVLGALPIQTIQTGTIPLVAGKSTIVRVPVASNGDLSGGGEFDGVLRIFVGGVETPESPIYSTNGPLAVGTSPAQLELDSSLNFVFIAPEGADVTFRAEVNPAGPSQLAETDFANNEIEIGPYNIACKGIPEIIYVPIDYRPDGGAIPNLPNFDLIKPGIGDGFVQGIFPSADWEYRRSDVPSKLWTESLTGGVFGGGGTALLNSLQVDFNLINPKPAFIYGWVPGALPGYNGQAIGIPGDVGMGNTEPIRHQRTFAHEIGHLFGLSHNSTKLNTVGVDVEHHLLDTQVLGQVKNGSLNDIMSAGLLTNQAWVAAGNYNFFLNHPKFICSSFLAATSGGGQPLMVGGIWNRSSGDFKFTHSLRVPSGVPSGGVDPTEANLILMAFAGDQRVAVEGLNLVSPADDCEVCGGLHGKALLEETASGDDDHGDSDQPLRDVGFVHVLPAEFSASDVDRIVVLDAKLGKPLGELQVSANAPELVGVTRSELGGSRLRLSWDASDADGDALTYFVRYSPDGQRLIPLGESLAAPTIDVDAGELPRAIPGQAYFEILATDGWHTRRLVERASIPTIAYLGGLGTAPETHVLTPNDSSSYPLGSTVILHSSGWDLEDRAITGDDVVWTSSLDGVIATGRITSTADLSVGTHLITCTIVDADGLTDDDAVTITITDRDLPSGETCQTNLGFAGPGASLLEVCGGDLSAGNSAAVTLSNAPGNSVLWLCLSTSSSPIPLLGGTLAAQPVEALFVGTTDGTGAWTAPSQVPGGVGPGFLFLQAVVLDGAQVEGFGLSNAVEVELLP